MIILVGIAGSGKGTQGKLLADNYGYQWISSGEVLRSHVTGERWKRMLAGELLDDEEIIRIWTEVLRTIKDKNKCVLDGFPRTIPQAEWLLDQSRQQNFKISKVLNLLASREAVKARLLDRARQDDHSSAIEARFQEYERSTVPIIEWLEKAGVEVVKINAEQPIEDVQKDIVKFLGLS